MPRTDLTVQTIGRVTALQDPTRYTPDVANGNSFNNASTRVFLYFTNSNAGTCTVTVAYPGNVDTDLAVPDRTYAIPTGERWLVGPFTTSYNQEDNSLTNRVLFNCDISASVTVEVLYLPAA